MISLFLLFRKRKNELLLEKQHAKQQFEQEISKAQIEIREETFRNISWELHDNIGQLLTLAKIQLQTNTDIDEIKATINKSIKEVRVLSKLINPDALKKMTLEQAINDEINRFNRLKFIKSSISVTGNRKNLDHKIEIVFFRILQEFFSNTIKHARATHLDITLNYQPNELIISAKDNGRGFLLKDQENSGIGISNIKNRAKLVNASATIETQPQKGTKLTITYPYYDENT
ncbi:hypothetical protein GCM10011368_11820 [Hyunsoonleella pacifica]|nr:hypothetical protein GCM10011368_11820 [Hyunsoonleella pacifica]